ncbi:peptidase [Lutimaribacter sp. EGI FJ00015]|uniref:Peptidase n=1 Tax=Lutimaribacter degradans TaxID=2945989 RepID=A0ACC5ZSH8_9RHOB|nr:NlpC/P60 family protein [Lutimaribacter sp. EGI FJ00013]MCM2561042.1 peptidase [Lutimaribacter sp. EGI FJ00013]MCO0612011.1 peptidase [Lutimaribacter sp. EGI FJ00015]MCO0634869.1 peptidase [Lutimaribacter sp. EGI FJ00014]
MTRKIVEAARGWIGTPYLHQASHKGIGTDCLGLLRGVWREVRGQEPEEVPPYTRDWAEPQQEEVLWHAAARYLQRVDMTDQAPGDVLLFRMRAGGIAKHVGIAATTGKQPTFIHAYSGHAVVESPLSAPWARRIVARFRFQLED